eukprot:TRINITY_DN121461_c0_g1_i1.p2 TRINITY_DN121461_c0_g1~~TRINITY_DN121461_c0_g1_i1.p2  ORF type:complete len:552 (-),score=53.69 TRINITY_DN121461_c0_g1_i1:38-1693(-)
MPCYKLPLLLWLEPQVLDLDVENDATSGEENGKKRIFIYEPEKKKNIKRKLVWYKGEIHTIKISVNYPLAFPVTFENILAITAGMEAISYNTNMTFQPKAEPTVLEVKVRPMETGILFLRGVSMGFAGIMCDHYVHPNGAGIYAADYEKKHVDTELCEIKVVEGIPKISTRLEAVQLWNGCLLGMKGEQCPVNIYIKNTSHSDLKIVKLELLIHTKQSIKTRLFKKLDLIHCFGESPLYGKWYQIQQVIPITDRADTYVFELHFASNPEFTIIEKYEVPITVQVPNELKRVVPPSIVCTKWDWWPKVEWTEARKMAIEMLKGSNKRVFFCSDIMQMVVGIQNQSVYSLLINLWFEDKEVAELEIETGANKNLAVEIPYDLMMRDKITLGWKIPSLCRHGKGLLADFVNMKDKIPLITFLPVRIHFETEGGVKKVRGKVGDMVNVTLELTNISQSNLKNLYPTIILSKCTAEVQELVNNDPFALAVSGELTQFVKELSVNETYKVVVSLLFTERNMYKVGSMCNFADKDLAYVSGEALTFEIDQMLIIYNIY